MAVGHAGQALSRCAGRHRGEQARPRPSAADARRCTSRSARSSTPPTCTRSRCRKRLADRLAADLRHGQGVLLQLRLRGQRGGDQARAPLRPRAEASTSRRSSSWRRRSTAARSRRCRPPAAARCRPASSRWWRASCACRSTTSKRCASVAEHNRNVVAVLVELIQGEGGINVCAPGVPARAARDLRRATAGCSCSTKCRAALGRTGKWFAYQHSGVKPDVMTLAKGLGNGVPIGACLAGGRAQRRCSSPATTARPSAAIRSPCAAALDHARHHRGRRPDAERRRASASSSAASSRARLAGIAGVKEIRGEGLMIGIELDRPCGELVEARRSTPAC